MLTTHFIINFFCRYGIKKEAYNVVVGTLYASENEFVDCASQIIVY